MTRYVKHPTGITEELLLSSSWDIIELRITTDLTGLTSWYETVQTQFANLRFDFSQQHLLKEQFQKDTSNNYGFEDVLSGGIYSWSLDWPVEKDLPLPPTFAASETLYPELLNGQPFKLQEKYKFGYFNTLCDVLGEDAFCYSRITQHETGAIIKKHVDGGLGLRVHIPIVASNASRFLYGEELDRNYTFTPGCVYIINANIPHSTINQGPVRAHIISDPGTDKLIELASLQGKI